MNWQLTQLTREVLYFMYDAKSQSNKFAAMNPEENITYDNERTLCQIQKTCQNQKHFYPPASLLSWENLTVSVPVSHEESPRKSRYREKRFLMDSVSGQINSGELIALMGPSGAGKSTLLSILSHRVKSATTSGKIYIHGKCVSFEEATAMIGFVPQHDLAFERLTVKEHLSFMAELRFKENKKNVNSWLHRVEELLEDLNLCESYDARLENLSGGERKRLALAVELLTRPSVLLCDEPCSGLDSSTALQIIQLLKKETQKHGSAVVCSLHQPAPKLLKLFDRVIVLGYKGKPNLTEFAIDDDGSLKLLFPTNNTEKSVELIMDSVLNKENLLETGFMKQKSTEEYISRKKISWNLQVYLLLKRNWINSKRRPLIARFATSLVALFTGLFIAIFYSGIKPDPPDQTVIQDLRGVLYLLSSEVMFANAYTAMGRQPDQLALLRRERGLYSPSAAYVADILILVPKALFEPVLLLSCVFWFIQLESLRTFDCYLAYAVLLMYSSLVANAYGCFLFGILGSANLASEVAAPLDLFLLLLSGMFLALPSLPMPLKYMRFLSAFYYCNDALATMHWAQVQNIVCPLDDDLPCLHNGTEVLHRWGFTKPPSDWIPGPADVGSLLYIVSSDLYGLFILAVIMHIGAYLGLRRQTNKEAAY